MPSQTQNAAPKREHIFPATIVEPLAVKWKKLVAEGNNEEANIVLEDIILKSSQMFARLAQHEGYHNTVDLDSLVLAAQARVAAWLTYWDPEKGALFSWLSKCAKNLFLGEVVRSSQHRKRFFPTSDNLEKFIGSEDHAVASNEAAEGVQEQLRQITSRWYDPQINCCIRFHIACIVENPKVNKKLTIKAGAYASGLNLDLSKFFYNWALFALRNAMYEKLDTPYTEQDLLRLSTSFTYIPDLLNVISWEQLLKVIALLGGNKIKFPTLTQMDQFKEEYRIYRQLSKSNLDPDSFAKIAKLNHVSEESAESIYQRVSVTVNDDNDGDFVLYD